MNDNTHNNDINEQGTSNQNINDTTINNTSSENKAWKAAKAVIGGTFFVLGSVVALAIKAKVIKDGKLSDDSIHVGKDGSWRFPGGYVFGKEESDQS